MIDERVLRGVRMRMRQYLADVLTYEKSTPHPEAAVIAAKCGEVSAFRQEIEMFCQDATSDDVFTLMQIDSYMVVLLDRLNRISPVSVTGDADGAAAARFLSIQDYVGTGLANQRFQSDDEGLSVYMNPRSELTHRGACIIADYYNQRYFTDGCKIVVTTSRIDLVDKIKSILAYKTDNVRVGFTSVLGEYKFSGKTPHPAPLILERFNGKTHLYVADSVGQNKFWIEALLPLCQTLGIVIAASSLSRQSDNGSCRSEALVYLKNAMQLPRPIQEHVRSYPAPEGGAYDVFEDCPDMLKTAQSSASVRGIEERSLYSTKEPKTFSEKLTPYRRSASYIKADLLFPDALGVDAHPEEKSYQERTYLEQKTQHHYQIIKAKVSDPSFSRDDYRLIEQRACCIPPERALPLVLDMRAELASMRCSEAPDFGAIKTQLLDSLSAMDLYQGDYGIIERLFDVDNFDDMHELLIHELTGISRVLESLPSETDREKLTNTQIILTEGLEALDSLSSQLSCRGLGKK